jgi:hypothetical protein
MMLLHEPLSVNRKRAQRTTEAVGERESWKASASAAKHIPGKWGRCGPRASCSAAPLDTSLDVPCSAPPFPLAARPSPTCFRLFLASTLAATVVAAEDGAAGGTVLFRCLGRGGDQTMPSIAGLRLVANAGGTSSRNAAKSREVTRQRVDASHTGYESQGWIGLVCRIFASIAFCSPSSTW